MAKGKTNKTGTAVNLPSLILTFIVLFSFPAPPSGAALYPDSMRGKQKAPLKGLPLSSARVHLLAARFHLYFSLKEISSEIRTLNAGGRHRLLGLSAVGRRSSGMVFIVLLL